MSTDLRHAVLQLVKSPGYKPVKPSLIAKRLGLVDEESSRELKRVVKQLVKAGELAFGASHQVMAADKKPARGKIKEKLPYQERVIIKNEEKKTDLRTAKSTRSSKHFTGTFRRAAAGYGFVRPEGTLPGEGRDADIFIPAEKCGDAANGDIVSVRLESKRGRMGKQEGRIIDVVERATNRFVGLYFEQGGMGMVQIDGRVFTKPISVGDPGAKGARPDDKVVLEMVRFPSHVRDGEAVITDILGQRGQPGVDTLSIIYEFNLPGEFADDALADARAQADKFDESIPRGRRDMTKETIITIDPVDARDFDDAISLDRLENGHWLLGVHIADVSHFVPLKTALDREAHDRATSVYLPDRVIPMLPEVISNNLASLQPNKVRYAITAMIEMTADGARVATDVFKSAIKSCRRFAYEEVDEFLAENGLSADSKDAPPPRPHHKGGGISGKLTKPVHGLLGRMHELAMMLRRRRFERGSLELSMPEIKIDLDKDGRVSGAHLEKNTESHQIIEEFMLSANEAVAERLADAGLLFLRRVHGSPDPRKLKALTEFVRELGFEAENLQNRFELQKLLDEVKGDPREQAVNYAVLRSMQRAIYSPEEEGHFALASNCYCHFTSPIRRYPDLTVHRLIDDLNRGRKPQQKLDDLLVLGDHCSEREQRAADAERELTKVKLLNYLADKIGLEMDGVITGVENFGLFITGLAMPAEGFVHISGLTDDTYRYDRAGHVIQGFRSGNTFRLGDTVRVAVAAVDVDSRGLDFRLVGRGGAGGSVSGGAGGKKRVPVFKKGRRPAGKPVAKPSAKTGPTKHKKTSRPGKRERRENRGG